MAKLKMISLILMCVSMAVSSTANAALSCCCIMGGAQAAVMQMDGQMDGDTDMPCHQNAADENAALCDGCGCDHGLQTSVLPAAVPSGKDLVASTVLILANQASHASLAVGVFQPPRQFS